MILNYSNIDIIYWDKDYESLRKHSSVHIAKFPHNCEANHQKLEFAN